MKGVLRIPKQGLQHQRGKRRLNEILTPKNTADPRPAAQRLDKAYYGLHIVCIQSK